MVLIKTITFLVLLSYLCACGPSQTGTEALSAEGVIYQGTLLDTDLKPLANIEVTLYETAESSLTNEDGFFSIETARLSNTSNLFFGTESATGLIEIKNIPQNIKVIDAKYIYNHITSLIELSALTFSNGIIPTPIPNTTAIPIPSKFDANGNTSAFGIPSYLTGNISRGKIVWDNNCESCHNTEKTNRTYGAFKRALTTPEMRSVNISNQQVADVTAYLNRSRR